MSYGNGGGGGSLIERAVIQPCIGYVKSVGFLGVVAYIVAGAAAAATVITTVVTATFLIIGMLVGQTGNAGESYKLGQSLVKDKTASGPAVAGSKPSKAECKKDPKLAGCS